jgi:hypothetical protein
MQHPPDWKAVGIVALVCVGSEIGGEKAVNICSPDEFWCGPTHERHFHTEQRVPMPLDTGASLTQTYTTTTSAVSHIAYFPGWPKVT